MTDGQAAASISILMAAFFAAIIYKSHGDCTESKDALRSQLAQGACTAYAGCFKQEQNK